MGLFDPFFDGVHHMQDIYLVVDRISPEHPTEFCDSSDGLESLIHMTLEEIPSIFKHGPIVDMGCCRYSLLWAWISHV